MIDVFYGCARRHRPFDKRCNVFTNDIDPKCYPSLCCDIRQLIDKQYDWMIQRFWAFIFTPPCNYYSRANYRRESSTVALSTKDLLPMVLHFCDNLPCDMPFLVENVMNKTLLGDLYPSYQFTLGGHTFWSNVISKADFLGLEFPKQNKEYVARSKRDGNYVVDFVIRVFLEKVVSFYAYSEESLYD